MLAPGSLGLQASGRRAHRRWVVGGSGIALTAVGIPLSLATVSHVDAENERQIAKVYNNHGYSISFLPDISLSKSVTLTQRGIVF
jgi:hypothetical protein